MTAKPKTRRKTGAATTINPDHINMHKLIVAGVVASLAAAVVTSWNGLAFIAEEQGLAPFTFVTALMIDVPLIVLTLARGALTKRGIQSRWLMVFIIGLTSYSSLANWTHSLATRGIDTPATLQAAVTNALAPWLILLMTEVLWLVTTKQKPSPAVLRARAEAAAARAKPKAKRAPRAPRTAPAVETGSLLEPPPMFDLPSEPALPAAESDPLAALRETAR